MAGTVAIQIVGDSRGVDHLLSRLDLLLGPAGMGAFLAGEVTPYLKARAVSRFASEGDSLSGGAWAPLSPVTVQIRQAMGYGGEHPINHRTGQLEQWVTGSLPSILASTAMSVLQYPNNVPTGKLKEKMTTAQTGKRSNGTDTVARPVLGIDETDYVAILTMLAFAVEQVGMIP